MRCTVQKLFTGMNVPADVVAGVSCNCCSCHTGAVYRLQQCEEEEERVREREWDRSVPIR